MIKPNPFRSGENPVTAIKDAKVLPKAKTPHGDGIARAANMTKQVSRQSV